MSKGLDCEHSDPYGQFSQTDEREAIKGRVAGGASNAFKALSDRIFKYVARPSLVCPLLASLKRPLCCSPRLTSSFPNFCCLSDGWSPLNHGLGDWAYDNFATMHFEINVQ